MILVLLIHASAPLFVADAIDTHFTTGSGTVEDPYIITDKVQLKNLSDYPYASFRLEADLVFLDEDFEGGGAFYRDAADTPRFPDFHGTLDGNGYTISGYRLDVYYNEDDSAYYTAMFGSNHGTIKNLTLSDFVYDFSRYGDLSAEIRFTSLAVNNYGTIERCALQSLVAFDFSESHTHTVSYGGFALNNYGRIEGCASNTNVYIASKTANVGGIAANNSGVIKRSYNTGSFTVLAEYLSAGGIAVQNSGTIEECYNNGYISAQIETQAGRPDVKIGGIAAENASAEGLIQNCFNTGTLFTIITTPLNCESMSNIVSIGGIAGKNDQSAAVLNCYNSGVISDLNLNGTFTADIGGIAGFNDGSITAVAIDYGIPAVPTTSSPDHALLKSAAEMKSADAYAGFDFAAIFEFEPAGNEFRLPILKNTPFEFEKKVAGVVITKLPGTLRYTEEDLSDDAALSPDRLRDDGLELCYRYNNTDLGTSPAADFDILYAPLWYGPNTIYPFVEQDGSYFVAAYTIEVIPTSLSSVSVDPLFIKTDYIIGIDEVFDITGAMLLLNYLDGTVRTIPMTPDYLAEDVSQILETPGIQKPVHIDFYGYQTVLYINVYNSTIQSDTYTLRPSADEEHDAYIRVAPGTTAYQLLSAIHQKDYVTVIINGHEAAGDTVLTTGAKLVLSYGGTTLNTVGVAVAGDLNNNGTVTITDLVLLRSHLLGISNLTGLPALAADLNNNSELTITDLVLIRSYLLGLSSIS